MKALNLYPTTEVDDLAWLEELTGLATDSLALHSFTDFRKV